MIMIVMVMKVLVMVVMCGSYRDGGISDGDGVDNGSVGVDHLCRRCRICTETRCNSPGTNEGREGLGVVCRDD